MYAFNMNTRGPADLRTQAVLASIYQSRGMGGFPMDPTNQYLQKRKELNPSYRTVGGGFMFRAQPQMNRGYMNGAGY